MDSQNPYNQHPLQSGVFGAQIELPNAAVVMVLGISSVVICALGPVLAIVALVLSARSRKLYAANPAAYSYASFKQLNTGRVCAIVGLCLGVVVWLMIVAYVIFVYMMISEVEEQIMQMQNIQ